MLFQTGIKGSVRFVGHNLSYYGTIHKRNMVMVMVSKLYVSSIRLETELPETSYLRNLPILQSLRRQGQLSFRKPVTFLVGENGIGKSTLIEAIAVNMGFNPEGGTLNFQFSTKDTHSELYRYLRVGRGTGERRDGFFLRAESFYNVASTIDHLNETAFQGSLLSSYGGISLHKQSHGESFLSLVANRFGGNGLYILDEPEAALSPAKLLELMCYMKALEESNSQFIISTHSPILMAYPGADVLQLTDRGIHRTDFRETDHYRITKRFLDSPDTVFRYLFEK